MENNNQDTGDFTFVQEKIKSKRKRKIKKALVYTLFTLVLAVLFGIVARFVFAVSGDFVASVLGIETEENGSDSEGKRSEVTFPSTDKNSQVPTKPIKATPTPAPTKELTPSASVTTPTPVPSPTPETVSPTEAAPAVPSVTPELPEKHPEDTATPTPAEGDKIPEGGGGADAEGNGNESGISQSLLPGYIQLLEEIKTLSVEVSKAVLQIMTTTRSINWMDEAVEVKQIIPGVIMGENSIELLIMTDYDKVEEADSIEVIFDNGSSAEAVLYSYDSNYNLAVLALPMTAVPKEMKDSMRIIELGDSDDVYAGNAVIALGSPNGNFGSVEFGFVTGTGNTAYIIDGEVSLFTTDLSHNDSSAGIVVNLKGELIGFISHLLDSDTKGVNTVVAIDSIRDVALSLLNGEKAAFFGIRAESIPAAVLETMGIENGIYVKEVIAQSPAYTAGIKKGDVITVFGDTAITDVVQFSELLSRVSAGDAIGVELYRSTKADEPVIIVDVLIGERD